MARWYLINFIFGVLCERDTKTWCRRKKELKKKVLFLNPTFEPNVFFSQFRDVAKSGDHHP
jgi:hypothetical protein